MDGQLYGGHGRDLLKTTYTTHYEDLGNGTVCIAGNKCFCKPWLDSRGSDIEKKIANGLQWFAFALSVLMLIYYAWSTWKATCGWEEVYVCSIESELFFAGTCAMPCRRYSKTQGRARSGPRTLANTAPRPQRRARCRPAVTLQCPALPPRQ